MMSLPIRPQPLRKLPVVWRCPCHTTKKATFLVLFSVCVPLCVCVHCTPSCVCIWNESPVLDDRVAPAPPLSHSFTWLPEARWPHDLSLQPLPSTKTGPNLVLSRSRERDCKPVNIMLYLDTYSALTALTHSYERRRITKTSSRPICVCGLQLFVETIAELQNCDATSNQCPPLNTRGRHCSVADEKPLHWGSRYARWAICHYM